MTDRKVIFVGGTSFSGSTLFDMMLGNDPHGFSCGEVRYRFLPTKPHNLTEGCGCGDANCPVWPELLKTGAENLYQRIFELHPNVRFIVDSSKDPVWIKDRTKDLRRQGIEVRNILIWKTPDEFFASRKKRGTEPGWLFDWTDYHKRYSWMVDCWRAVRYADLVKSSDVFKRVCETLDIPYQEGKQRYWERQQHTLFGNTSAKIHLYDKESERFQQFKQDLNNTIEGENAGADDRYKQVAYVPPAGGLPPSDVDMAHGDLEARRVLKVLADHDVVSQDGRSPETNFEFSALERAKFRVRLLGSRVKRQLRALWVSAITRR